MDLAGEQSVPRRAKGSPALRSPRLGCSGMSGVGAAILEPQEHAQSESVRVYLSQSILPAITEALTAMEKERCPNPVPHPFAALLDKHACVVAQSSRTTSHLACGQARGASQSEIVKLSRLYIYDAHWAAVAVGVCV